MDPSQTPLGRDARTGQPVFRIQIFSGGGVTLQQLALSDALGRPFAEVMSTPSSPSPCRPPGRRTPRPPMTARVYPELAAAGLLRGAYEREGDPSFTVDLRDGVLHIAVKGGSPSPTRPLTETTFVRDDRIGEADSPSREDASPGSCYGSVAGTASGPE